MIIKTKEEYLKFIDEVIQNKETYISLDIESEPFTSIKSLPRDLALEGIGIYANKKLKAYILPQVLDNNFQKLLDSKEIIFHNAKFDLDILRKEGFKIDKINYHDTLIMSWLCNENKHSHKLKDLAASVLKIKKENITTFTDIGNKPELAQFGILPKSEYKKALDEWIEKMGDYCLKDCEYTYKLFFKFKIILEKEDIWKEYYELEMPFVKVLLGMEHRGIKIDVKYLQELGEILDKKIIKLSAEIYKEVGRDIDINSAKQLREYLFIEKKYNLPEQYRTPKGEFSTDVSSLKYLAKIEKIKIADLLLKYRELSKLNSTYVKGMLEDAREGIIYPSFNQIGTVTGRLSSNSPNAQNIPRRDDEFNIRKAFIPRQGYKFICADYGQIELRLIAYFSKDERMLNVYRENGDIHAETAKEIGCDRVTAKGINFGINYGRTAYGLSEGLGISKEEAQKFIDRYFVKYPRVKLFMQQAANTIGKKYAIRTLLKRKRRFPDYATARKSNDKKLMGQIERQACNSAIQGSASDIIKVAMRNLADKIKIYDSHILIQVHDELVIETLEKNANKVLSIVKDIMETPVDLKIIKLVVEPKITNCWEK